MSVPGVGEKGVQLTGASYLGGSGSAAVLPSENYLGASPVPDSLPSRESPHLRFEIEDVEEAQHHAQHHADPQQSLTSPADMTVTSFGYNTAEAVPMTVYYRHTGDNIGEHRPSLDHLREGRVKLPGKQHEMSVIEEEGEPEAQVKKKRWQFWKRNKDKKPPKFGWIMGVLIRCLLNIWGVMLFIRLSWVVGQAGIGLASVIILLSAVVTTITTLSMSAIATNGEVKGGGAYYLISRSLGPEFGGAIGIIFSLANAVAVALYVVGFAETVTELMMEEGTTMTGNQIHDIRIIGFGVVTVLLVVALAGLDWEAKVQVVLLIILLIAITDFLIGTFIPRSADSETHLRGFTGYLGNTFLNNGGPEFRESEGTNNDFFTIFAVFFPAATGILAGANISGDLKDPQKAIPKGTLLAIGITTVVYLGMAWIVGAIVIRDAPGRAQDFFDSIDNGTVNLTLPSSTDVCNVYNFTANFPDCNVSEPIGEITVPVDCIYGNASSSTLDKICELAPVIGLDCDYGLLNHFQVMEMVSGFGPLVTAGIFAATLSSALTSLISAPKIFQRVCEDKVFPMIYFFAKGGGKSGTEPVRAYVLAYVIAVACISIGSLNEIALIISNFFLVAYALINYSCFAASFAKSPGWRPAFKLYNKWVALIGAALCLGIMFVIRWYYALITIVVVAGLYQLVDWLKPDINWGSSTQAFLYSYSMRNLLKLEKLEEHVKNFRPQFLVLSGPPSSRPDLVHFVSHVSKEAGIMVCGQVLLGDYTTNRRQLVTQSEMQRRWLRRQKIKAFHNIVSASSLREGTLSLLQLSGLGKLRPNTLVIGYKSNWTKCPQHEVEEYMALMHDAFDLRFGVVIMRLRAGFDATEREEENAGMREPHGVQGGKERTRSDSPQDSHGGGLRMRTRGSDAGQPLLGISERYNRGFTEIPLATVGVDASPRKPQNVYQPIEEHREEDVTDVDSVDSYAMAMEEEGRLEFDDHTPLPSVPSQSQLDEGEPTPELITMPSRFERVQENGNIDVWWLYDDGGLAILLPYLLSRQKKWKNCKLRIFTGGSTRNIDQARLRMTSLLRKFRIDFSTVIEVTGINSKPSQESIDKYRLLPLGTSNDESEDDKKLDKMTLRHIRLGELLHEYSNDARLIVITISVPQRMVSAHCYMSWLEVMSQGLPPILLMRGNQSSVLTFYS